MPTKTITNNPLDRWVEETGVRLIDLSDAQKISRDALTRWRKLGFYPTRDVAIQIARITGGEVLPNDWIDIDLTPFALRQTREWKRTLKAIETSEALKKTGKLYASRKVKKSQSRKQTSARNGAAVEGA